MALLFTRMNDRLDDLADEVRDRELSMRAYPILAWHGDALEVRVEPGQLTVLAPAAAAVRPPDPLGEVGRQARRVWGELAWVGTAREQEMALPRLLGVSLGATALAVA